MIRFPMRTCGRAPLDTALYARPQLIPRMLAASSTLSARFFMQSPLSDMLSCSSLSIKTVTAIFNVTMPSHSNYLRMGEYVQCVAGMGYRWMNLACADGPEVRSFFLTTGHTQPQEILHPKTRFYDPVEESGLFHSLSELDSTQDAIRQFANQYGLLTAGFGPSTPISEGLGVRAAGQFVSIPDPIPGAAFGSGYGETLEVWQREISLMSEAVDLWKRIRLHHVDISALRNRFVWTRKARAGSRPTLRYFPHGDNTKSPPLHWEQSLGGRRPLEFGDVISPALNRLEWLLHQKLSFSVTPWIHWGDPRGPAKLTLRPSGLSEALWLQLAQAIAGEKTYRRCICGCGRYFETTPGTARSTRKWATNACKQRAHRQRKKESL